MTDVQTFDFYKSQMYKANDQLRTLRAIAKIEVTGNLVTFCSQNHTYTVGEYTALVNGEGSVDITDSVSSSSDFCGVCEESNPKAEFIIAPQFVDAYEALIGVR